MRNLKLPNLTVPSFLSDLFSDLRDRRLLPLIGVLAVGTLAVPFALSDSGSEPTDPGPATVEAPRGGSAGPQQLAVVSSDAGLRDYRHRLGGDPKDPFRQHFTGPVLAGSELGKGADGPTTEIGGGGGGGGAGAGGSDEPGAAGEEPLGHSEGGEPPIDDGDPGDGSKPEPPSAPEEPEPAFVVTVRLGSGDEPTVRKLSEPTVLPSEDNPLLVFRGLNEKGNKAVFRISSSVSAVFGDANCLEGTDRCELIEVEPGFPVVFVYGESERLYRLTVVDIEHNR
jgi:hypothetical protein